jgi:hypothetical protein
MNIGLRMRLSIIVLLFILPYSLKAQYYQRLAARDFTGTPPAGENFLAYTNCNVQYTYQVTRHNGQYSLDFDVEVVFNKDKSYIRFNNVSGNDMLLHVLRHEQGHYNIAYLMKCELSSVFKHHHYSANYEQEIVYLFKQVETKYHKINEDYENQTQHMQNDASQEKWNAWFSRALDSVPVGV